jgi:hypothetical protein
MLMQVKTIMWILDVMKGNIHEAENYAEKACHMKGYCPECAEWCTEMAKRHLSFNDRGMSLLNHHHSELMAKVEGELAGGIDMMIHERRAWLNEEAAEIHAKLDKNKG